MSTRGKGWNEATLSEDPAVALLQKLGFTYVPPELLEAERESLKEPIVSARLVRSLLKLNPWLSQDNAKKTARALAASQATSLIEASEKNHTDLTHGVSLAQDGKASRDVRFFDFDDPFQNDLVVTRQYSVKGAKKHIRPDIVVLVNGIPLVVIECKSPTLGEGWKVEAIDQFVRYQETDDKYRQLGAPRLFETVQILIATCGQAAVYGTVTTPYRFYAEWKTSWPVSDKQLRNLVGAAPSAQDRTLVGLLSPSNLLDIVRNFVVFEPDAASKRKIRKLCRYQQFLAVNKAIERARNAKKAEDRGGVVWHTQGSGKSLTMLWLALKLRRDPFHENPTLVVVTDRKDLDTQITKTFIACGFPSPEQAEGLRELQALLASPPGKTILTTVQKFQELRASKSTDRRVRAKEPAALNSARNIFVLADEAHRTQYGGLAANMRSALPNAAFFGFTGTPIDKNDRSTLTTFGPYIDTYTIEQAVADGATLPIFYEGRLAELHIVGNNLDTLFDRVFADRSEAEREAIKKKYGKEQTLAGAPKRVETIALDIIDHFTNHIGPNRFKAQIVAGTRDIAALYKDTLDRLHGPASAVIISGTNKDTENLVRHHTSEEVRKELITRFLNQDDPLQILVVCDMLLTGFDAPVEQVMYLDSALKEHTLLQAIARVNRTAEGKTYGLIVDYWGVSEALTEALAIFAPADVQGAMAPKHDELPRLQARHRNVLRFFVRVKDKDSLQDCVAALAAEDTRAQFDDAFKKFAQSLDMMLPDPGALRYKDDARWLGKIRGAVASTYHDDKIDVSDCGAKVKKLIDEAVSAEGIQILVQRVSLFSAEFEEKLKALSSDAARASEMEHALRKEIHVRLEEDPVYYTSLRQRLEQIIEDRKAQRIDAAEELKRLEELKKLARGAVDAAQEAGLSETGYAIYGLLEPKKLGVQDTGAAPYRALDASIKELASLLEELLQKHVQVVDWTHKDDVQREMRKGVKRQLRAAGYGEQGLEKTTDTIVDIMKRRHGR